MSTTNSTLKSPSPTTYSQTYFQFWSFCWIGEYFIIIFVQPNKSLKTLQKDTCQLKKNRHIKDNQSVLVRRVLK